MGAIPSANSAESSESMRRVSKLTKTALLIFRHRRGATLILRLALFPATIPPDFDVMRLWTGNRLSKVIEDSFACLLEVD